MSQSKKLGDVKVKIEVDSEVVNEILSRIREAMDDPDSLIESASTALKQRDEALGLLTEMVDALISVLYTKSDEGRKLDHRPALLDVLTREPAPEYYANELTAFVQRVDLLIPAAAQLARQVAEQKRTAKGYAAAILSKASE